MRQEEFNNIINLLETDEMFGVSVYDLSSGIKNIELNKTKEQIIEKYGSVANFFNGLFSNGATKIGIQPLKKNGQNQGKQNWVKHNRHSYLEVPLLPAEVQSAPASFQSSAPVQYSQPLAGPGLSIPEMISLHVDRNDKTRLDVENKFLKEENERLKEQIYQFKDKELKWNNSNAKSEQNANLVGAFIENIDKIPALLGAFKGQSVVAPVIEAAIPGLGNPNNLSEQKRSMISVIAQCDEFTVSLLASIYDGLQANQDFSNELNELLKKYQLIQ